MKRLIFAVLVLAGCAADETLYSYGASDYAWRLTSLDGKPFTAKTLMRFGEDGAVRGEGPCNSFGAKQTAPYPWFALSGVAATKRACPDLAAEGQFFEALGAMTLSEVSGRKLILSNDEGREMVFDGLGG